MTSTLELKLCLTEHDRQRLEARARQQGLTLEEYVRTAIERLARQTDRQFLRSLSRTDRNRRLAKQAEEAAALYEADLARPVEERELTAFTALDGEEVYDHTP